MDMSQRQATFGELELQVHELLTQVGSGITTIFREYKTRLGEEVNKNQQLMADIAKLKVQQTKEPEPKEKHK